MWYIVLIGYLFVTVLFSAAQPTPARMVIYLVFWSLLPTLFVFWVAKIRRRNRWAKQAEIPAGDGARAQASEPDSGERLD